MIFGFQNALNIKRKNLQIRCFKKHFFYSIFEWIVFVLASENEGKMNNFRTSIENTHFAKIIVFMKGKYLFFWFGASKNQLKFDGQTHWKIASKKKAWKIEFWNPFGFPNSFKIGAESDVKRSLLRDAMETMRNSSAINGTHSL